MVFLGGSGGHIDDDLGEFGDDGGEVVERFFSFGDSFGYYEAGEHAIARGEAGKDDVAVLFGADLDVFCKHGSDDVGVANGGDFGVDAKVLGPVEQALIGHDGGDDGI